MRLLCVAAVLHLLAVIATIALFDWSALFSSVNLKQIVLIVPIALGCALSAGIFVALPIAIAYTLHKGDAQALSLGLVLSVLSIVGVACLGWWALPTAAVYLLATFLIWRVRSGLRVGSARERRYSVSVGYVLLVAGGLVGVHNYYLSRAWAGVLYFAFLLFGTLAVGTFFTYVFFTALSALLVADAALMPVRITRLRADGISP